MKDVKDEVIKNEVTVKELVEFLTNDMYPNYKPLIDMFGGVEEIKEILYKNIKSIKRINKDVDAGEYAWYDPKKREITIVLKQKIDIDTIKKDNTLKNTIVHESIHAIFAEIKGKRNIRTGCDSINKSNISKIRGVMSGFVKYEGKKSLFKNILNRERFFKLIGDKRVGDGLNEGITVWLTKKIVGTDVEDKAIYPLEEALVEIIEELKGEKEVLKIAKGDYSKIAQMFNLTENGLILFLKSFDVAARSYANIGEFENPNEISEKDEMFIYFFNIFWPKAQDIFVNAFVIPELERKMKDEGITINNLDLLCRISGRLRGIHEFTKFNGANEQSRGEKGFKIFEEYKINKFIEYSNNVDVDNLSEVDILNIKQLFDYVLLYCDKESASKINMQFYKKVNEQDRFIRQKINIANALVNGSTTGLDDIAKNIIKSRKVLPSDVTENRAARRAAKKAARKKDKQDRKMNR